MLHARAGITFNNKLLMQNQEQFINSNKGIQELLKTEQICQAKVENARHRRIARLKQAGEDAAKEVSAIEKEQENLLRELQCQTKKNHELVDKAIKENCSKIVAELEHKYQKNKDKVMNMILDFVLKT
ncbi:hypothetical protein GJ496_001739 [Pomphorhynchus laevis]|nr:hypothetical protein GJ496_001739 [Pomphorhynchus laevis]